MKKSRYSDSQIINIFKQAEVGTRCLSSARNMVRAAQRFTSGGANTEGWTVSLMARMKELEDENRGLKRMYAEERLKSEVLKKAMAKKVSGKAIAQRVLSILLAC